VTALHGHCKLLGRLVSLGASWHTVIREDRRLVGRQGPARLIWPARYDVEFMAAGCVPDDVVFSQAHGELVQDVGAAHNAAVALVAGGVVALQVVERGVAANVTDYQARLAVRQLSFMAWNGYGRFAQPACGVCVQDAI